MKKTLLVFLLPLFAIAQIPAYYNTVDFTLTGDALKDQLSVLITTTHTTELYYTSNSQVDVWDAIEQTDLTASNASDVFLIYGYDDTDAITKNDQTRDKSLSCHQSSCTGLWNREHVFPKSLATPSLTTSNPGSGTDAHNLRACDGQMNSSRNNRPYEDASGTAGITPTTGNWYPGDEWKGDVARMIMYMYVRYPSQCKAISVGVGSTSYSNFGDMPNIFLEWNAADPVSAYEMNRNDILQAIQGNRNPFIDNPFLATRIWNGPAATDTWNVLATHTDLSYIQNVSVYPTVTANFVQIKGGESQLYEYQVFNTLGQQLVSGKTKNKIDLSAYTIGVYYITIKTNRFEKVVKIVKV